MVEYGEERTPGVVKLLKVDDPAGVLVDRPLDGEFDTEAVTMKAGALMASRNTWQAMCCLESEVVHEPDIHGKWPWPIMYIALSKKPRKVNRNKSKRYRAKLKAKDKSRRNRVYCVK